MIPPEMAVPSHRQDQNDDVHQTTRSSFGQTISNTYFLQQIAKHQHGDQRHHQRKEQVNDGHDTPARAGAVPVSW